MPSTVETCPAGPLLEWRKAKAESLKGLERRVYATGHMELREADDGVLHLTGYASVTDTPYEVGFYVETIRRGAFARTLSEAPDVVLLLNHEGLPLARTKAGTLRLAEDDHGLKVDADLDPIDPDTIRLKRKRDRGDLDGQMSMAFQVTSQKWNEDYTQREILALGLARGDVSVVTHGASPTTSSSIRSADAVAALADLGAPVVLAALVEWRNWTLVPLEQRAGKALSAATMEVLTQIAALMTTADEAMDEAIPALAELMGVPDPDTEDEAGASVERSIDNEKDLCTAIRGALRWWGGDDERRAVIIKRAGELSRPGLLPEVWHESGALRGDTNFDDCVRFADAERLEARETYSDTLTALDGALHEKLVTDGECWYVWVQDFTDTEVIYYASGDLYSAPYTLTPSGPVEIGDGVKVRPVTEYVERAAEAPAPVVAVSDFTLRARQRADVLAVRGRR